MNESTTTTPTMASPASRYPLSYITLLFMGLTVIVSSAAEYSSSSTSFGFKKFDVKSEHLWSLYGDAKVVGNGSYVQIKNGSWKYSSGSVMYKQPVKLLYEGNHPNSFGTYFVFSLSPENGNGMAFQLVRKGKYHPEFSVDLSGNHVGVRVGNKQALLSQSKLLLNMTAGKTLQCWIDYEASAKRIEVRISRLGEKREDGNSSPLFSCNIDLTEMFGNEGVFLGLYAKNGNTTQMCKIYAWSFKLRRVPTWQHSEPLDPQGYKKEDVEPAVMHSRSGCVLRVVTALVFGTGCGALGALIVLCVWTVIAAKKPVAPQEYVVQQPVVFDYDKVKVIVIDKSDCGKN